jgi:hypothetical protein
MYLSLITCEPYSCLTFIQDIIGHFFSFLRTYFRSFIIFCFLFSLSNGRREDNSTEGMMGGGKDTKGKMRRKLKTHNDQ